MERLLPLFTEDVIYEDVTMGVMTRGASELRAFAEGVFSRFPDVTFELQSSFADGTRGGAEWVMRGTRDLPEMPGQRVEVRGASIFEFVGDKIRRCSD
jgi:ketosteroid isomerase-like protein